MRAGLYGLADPEHSCWALLTTRCRIVDGPSGYFILSLIKNLLLVAGIGYGVSSYMGTDLTELAGKSKKVETGTKKVDNSEFANSAWGKKK